MLLLTATTTHLDRDDPRHGDVTCLFGMTGGSIGRHVQCDMVLPDPQSRISRKQAQVVYAQGRYIISNTSVANPMYVNGVELSPGSHRTISSGDELRMGSYVVMVTESADVAQAPNGLSDGFVSIETPQTASDTPDFPDQTSPDFPADPLLALTSDRQEAMTNADPFADLLPKAVPIGKNNTDPSHAPENVNRSVSSTRVDTVASEQLLEGATEEQLAAISPAQEMVKSHVPSEKSLDGKRRQAEIPGNFAATAKSVSPAGTVSVTGDPFEDILAQALPAERVDSTPKSSNTHEQAQKTQDPFPVPRAQQSGTSEQNQSPEHWTPPLSGLAGDPFADLMGPPVESHIVHVPVSASTLRETEIIPEDFNPFLLDGMAQRNSSDPLTPLGDNIEGLADVVPKRTIDSIYDPSTESASALVANPLDESRERALQVEQSVDPMKLFSNQGDALDGLSGGLQTDNVRSVSDHAREMTSFFHAPVAKFDPAMVREEAIDDDIPTQLPVELPPQAASKQEVDLVVSAATNPPIPAANKDQHSSRLSRPEFTGAMNDEVNKEQQYVKSGLIAADSAQSPDVSPVPADATLRTVEQHPDDRRAKIASAEELMSAFKRGAGLQDWQEQSMTPEWMETTGRMLQAAVQGVVSLLAARATVKQEIHLSVTLINPKSNNPLKFLPDGHTALLQMLGPRIPGFMTCIDAIEDAFEDLIKHQTAIAAGTQAAIEALFRRFDPGSIEYQNPQNRIGEKISATLYHARLWNEYKNHYRLINNEVKDDFFRRLGSDFQDAYNKECGND